MPRLNAVITQMTGGETFTKLIKYALRITSLKSGRVKYTSFSCGFTIDFLWIFVVFLVSVFLVSVFCPVVQRSSSTLVQVACPWLLP